MKVGLAYFICERAKSGTEMLLWLFRSLIDIENRELNVFAQTGISVRRGMNCIWSSDVAQNCNRQRYVIST
jgi:hypothetical protein